MQGLDCAGVKIPVWCLMMHERIPSLKRYFDGKFHTKVKDMGKEILKIDGGRLSGRRKESRLLASICCIEVIPVVSRCLTIISLTGLESMFL